MLEARLPLVVPAMTRRANHQPTVYLFGTVYKMVGACSWSTACELTDSKATDWRAALYGSDGRVQVERRYARFEDADRQAFECNANLVKQPPPRSTSP